MRIGLITSSYPLTPDDTVNAGVFVRDLAKELVALGNEVYVITPFKYGPVIPDTDISIVFIPWWGGEKDLASKSMRNFKTLIRFTTLISSGVWTTIRIIRKLQIDILLAMWAIPSGLFALAANRILGVPYGVWALGSDIWARGKYPFGRVLVRKILQMSDFCFADGIQLADEVSNISQRACKFVPSTRRLPSFSQRTDIDDDHIRFLYIGRYEYNKGPDILIEAMRLCVDWGLTAHLHMFGTGSLDKYLRQQVVGYESSIFVHGYASPKTCVHYMHLCDWLVIPSRIESIPLIFSDAIKMNIPILATDVGDLSVLVKRYHVGKIVRNNEPLFLAKEMANIIQNREAKEKYEFNRALEFFDIHRSAVICNNALQEVKRDNI